MYLTDRGASFEALVRSPPPPSLIVQSANRGLCFDHIVLSAVESSRVRTHGRQPQTASVVLHCISAARFLARRTGEAVSVSIIRLYQLRQLIAAEQLRQRYRPSIAVVPSLEPS